jgi:uncharacterized protein
LKIDASLLSKEPVRFVGEEDPSFLELEGDEFVRTDEPARYDFTAQLAALQLIVKGSIEIGLTCQCARCNEWTEHVIRVGEFFRAYKIHPGKTSIDLTDDMREDILLAFPIRFICSSSCLGLCPYCGANLNKEKCSCASRRETTGWNALERLKLKQSPARGRNTVNMEK